MNFKNIFFKKHERFWVLAVTIGSILEWHEVFLYVYWAPLIDEISLYITIPAVDLINTLLIVATAWVARPFGGIIFGHIGDRWGRRTAFILSIILISLPSILTWLISSILTWGIFTLIFYGLMRFLQGIPSGGELPGAICYLSENAGLKRKSYISSFAFVGCQIGQIISLVECLLLQKYLTHEQLLSWGWKLSFLIGGILGLCGYFLRTKLHESYEFQHLKDHQIISKNPIKKCFEKYWKEILICFGISAYEVVGFYLIAVFPFEYFPELFSITINENIAINIYFLLLSTILIPVIGYIGGTYNIKFLLLISVILTILLSYPLYHVISNAYFGLTILLGTLLIIFLSFSFAFLPLILYELFPTVIRFTGIGFSFNIADSFIVGISPILTHALKKTTSNPSLFILLLPIMGILFLFSFRLFERRTLKFKTNAY